MSEDYKQYMIAIACVMAGVLIGFLFEKVVLGKLKKIALYTRWKWDELVVGSFKGIAIFLGLAGGIYSGIHFLPQKELITPVSSKVLFAIVVFALTVLIARIIVRIIKVKTDTATGILPSTSIIANISRMTIYLIGILVVLQTLGISVTPVLTALGVGGLAVALALQDTLSNLFSGIQVTASRQIHNGDYIKLESGEEGYVADITWRNTTIRMLSNNLIVIPNSKIASSIVTNYYLPDKETAVLVEVGVSYESDLEKVEQITVTAAEQVLKNIEGGVKTFKPFIRYHTFADSCISFTVILRGQEFTSQFLLKHEFVKILHKCYRDNAIEIPFPIRTVYLKNQNK